VGLQLVDRARAANSSAPDRALGRTARLVLSRRSLRHKIGAPTTRAASPVTACTLATRRRQRRRQAPRWTRELSQPSKRSPGGRRRRRWRSCVAAELCRRCGKRCGAWERPACSTWGSFHFFDAARSPGFDAIPRRLGPRSFGASAISQRLGAAIAFPMAMARLGHVAGWGCPGLLVLCFLRFGQRFLILDVAAFSVWWTIAWVEQERADNRRLR